MKLLAVIEDKNKRLRAYLPAFMSPFRACMSRYCSVHDVPNFASTDSYICHYKLEHPNSNNCVYVDTMKENVNIFLLLETEVLYEEPAAEEEVVNPNVAVNDDGYLVVTVSIDMLFGLFGRYQISVDSTWESFIGSYTQDQLLQATVQIPYPAITAGLCGVSTKGMTNGNVADGEVSWQFPNGDTYLDFGLEYKRPTAYTLDSIPGLNAHFGSIRLPGILDEPAYGHSLTDIVVEKDISCVANLTKSIPVVNGLMYMPTMREGKMYIRSAAELFWNHTYQSAAVMMMDYSELLGDENLVTLQMSDCTFIDAKFNGKDYVLTIKLPDQYTTKFNTGTMFTVLDGRLITFDKIRMRGVNVVSIYLNDNELRYMRERDMQLTDNIRFNEFAVRPIRTHLEWLEAQFFTGDNLRTVESEDSINQNRSFFFFLPHKDIYINEYVVDDRLNYNGLIVHGNVAGMLQSCKGHEIFEHVILNYMDIRVLKHVTGEKPDLVYGSDAHILGYAPYNYLTTLEKHISDTTRQSNISLESMPFIDRRAPEAVLNSSNRFRLLDVVKLK